MATMTACAATSMPSPNCTTRAGPFARSAGDVARGEDLGAELDGLPAGPVGELGAGHAVGEAEVVLDPRRLAGLAAGRLPLDQQGAQPLRRAVDGGAETGRPATDDDEVVEVRGRCGRQADGGRHLGRGGRHQRLSLRRDHQRQPVRADAGGRQQPLPSGSSTTNQR